MDRSSFARSQEQRSDVATRAGHETATDKLSFAADDASAASAQAMMVARS